MQERKKDESIIYGIKEVFMKKLFVVILAAVLLCGLCAYAFAATPPANARTV
jgi:hypothetical protein